jgi:CRP/FNR family cyclic AMP-dependent transcriptional regulator
MKVARPAIALVPPPAAFDVEAFLDRTGLGRTLVELKKNQVLFSQGDAADAVFYIQKGSIKLTIVSQRGKEATVALLNAGNFVGESCVAAAEHIRMVSATGLTRCTLMRIERLEMVRVLHEEHAFADLFVTFLLARNVRIQEDLVDQLFNSSEKRLARILLLLAQFGKEGKPETVVPKISQEVLAEMIGTTRSRVNFFMNRFRKLGFIKYSGGLGGLEVHSSLLNVVLHD